MKKIIYLALFSLLFIAPICAADGDLDASFGTNGIVNDNFGGSFGIFTRSVKIQPDGKILTGSAVLNASFTAYDFGLLRYNTNGTLDASFGTNGRQIVDVDGGSESLPTILLQTDGKIIVAGQRFVNGQNIRGIVLTRLNANGSFDASFGANGKVITTFDSANKVNAGLQADGKIVVVGNWSGSSFSAARFNADGTPDDSFGINGAVQTNITGNSGVSYAVAFQADGKILLGGLIVNSSSNLGDFVVIRYSANGAIDTSFDGDGYARVDFSGMRDAAQSLVVQPDGKIIAAGLATIAGNVGNVFGIARFNSDGSLDSGFGAGGKVSTLPVNAFIDQINDRYPTILQPDGKIVIGRTRFINNNQNGGRQWNIARFTPSGALDTTFGAGGQIATVPTGAIGDLALQTDGKIVAAGSGDNGVSTNVNATTARYLNTAGSPTVNNPALRIADFDGDGKSDASVFRNGNWFINPSSNPNVAENFSSSPQGFYGVQFGQSGDKLTPADFDGDGKTDIAVWRENGSGSLGYFYILQSATSTVRIAQFGQTGDDPRTVGDWDGDGKADLAVYRADANGGQSFFYYRPSSQPSVDFVTIHWGTSGDEAVRGDFDGDGKLDAAVFRPADQTWYIRQSSNNLPRYDSWGTASDKRVSGDFDGDGKTDLTVFRNGIWYIKQSSNSQPLYRSWGTDADKIVAGDYDGDGKTDVAMWRDGTYYVLQTTNSQANYRQFGAAGDLPVASAFTR